MNPTNEKQIPNEPERGPEETQLEAEELDAIAGGAPRPLCATVDY
jgi:hypothetical protein